MRALAVAGVAVAALALSACGEDDDVAPQVEGPIEATAENQAIYEQSGWTTERDPLTGIELRCLTMWSDIRIGSGGGGGLATHCYQLEDSDE